MRLNLRDKDHEVCACNGVINVIHEYVSCCAYDCEYGKVFFVIIVGREKGSHVMLPCPQMALCVTVPIPFRVFGCQKNSFLVPVRTFLHY